MMKMKKYVALLVVVLFLTPYAIAQTVKPKCLEGNCKNKIGTYRYADSSIYVGSFNEKLRSGNGKIVYRNKAYYDGEWLNDMKNGFGVFVDSLGNKYEGEFVNDKENGKGKYIDILGNEFFGNWNQGQLSGQVKINFKDGAVYEGNYNSGINGKGKMVYADGSFYVGNFTRNMRNGIGEYNLSNYFRYEGNWKDNEINGQGEFFDILNSKKIASGQWKTIKEKGCEFKYLNSDGLVFCLYDNKDLYLGTMKNGMKDGEGMLKFNGGGYYDGEWLNDIYNGFGRLVSDEIGEFEGEWKDGKQNGFGYLREKNKSEKEGFWENGTFIGNNIDELYEIDSRHYCELYEELDLYTDNDNPYSFVGNCVDGLLDGEWRFYYENDLKSIINFNKGIPHGHCSLKMSFSRTKSSARMVSGYFENGKLNLNITWDTTYSNIDNEGTSKYFHWNYVLNGNVFRVNEKIIFQNKNIEKKNKSIETVWISDTANIDLDDHEVNFFGTIISDKISGSHIRQVFNDGQLIKEERILGEFNYGNLREYSTDGKLIKDVNYLPFKRISNGLWEVPNLGYSIGDLGYLSSIESGWETIEAKYKKYIDDYRKYNTVSELDEFVNGIIESFRKHTDLTVRLDDKIVYKQDFITNLVRGNDTIWTGKIKQFKEHYTYKKEGDRYYFFVVDSETKDTNSITLYVNDNIKSQKEKYSVIEYDDKGRLITVKLKRNSTEINVTYYGNSSNEEFRKLAVWYLVQISLRSFNCFFDLGYEDGEKIIEYGSREGTTPWLFVTKYLIPRVGKVQINSKSIEEFGTNHVTIFEKLEIKNGKIIKELYCNKKLLSKNILDQNGNWTKVTYYENNKIKSIRNIQIYHQSKYSKDFVIHKGEQKTYYEDGRLQTELYRESEKILERHPTTFRFHYLKAGIYNKNNYKTNYLYYYNEIGKKKEIKIDLIEYEKIINETSENLEIYKEINRKNNTFSEIIKIMK